MTPVTKVSEKLLDKPTPSLPGAFPEDTNPYQDRLDQCEPNVPQPGSIFQILQETFKDAASNHMEDEDVGAFGSRSASSYSNDLKDRCGRRETEMFRAPSPANRLDNVTLDGPKRLEEIVESGEGSYEEVENKASKRKVILNKTLMEEMKDEATLPVVEEVEEREIRGTPYSLPSIFGPEHSEGSLGPGVYSTPATTPSCGGGELELTEKPSYRDKGKGKEIFPSNESFAGSSMIEREVIPEPAQFRKPSMPVFEYGEGPAPGEEGYVDKKKKAKTGGFLNFFRGSRISTMRSKMATSKSKKEEKEKSPVEKKGTKKQRYKTPPTIASGSGLQPSGVDHRGRYIAENTQLSRARFQLENAKVNVSHLEKLVEELEVKMGLRYIEVPREGDWLKS